MRLIIIMIKLIISIICTASNDLTEWFALPYVIFTSLHDLCCVEQFVLHQKIYPAWCWMILTELNAF